MNIPTVANTDPSLIKKAIDEASSVLVVTGAGISEPSGLPVYRNGTPRWIKADLEKISRSTRYKDHLDELWTHWHKMAQRSLEAEPNAAHRALARWQQSVMDRGQDFTLLTQNIDGLHCRAGSLDVIEAHGSILRAQSIPTGEVFDYRPEADNSRAPKDNTGSSETRVDVVLFGEVPRGMERAAKAAQEANLVVCIGTSGMVWPVGGLMPLAVQTGTTSLLVNDHPWPHATFHHQLIADVTTLDDLIE